MLGEIVPNYPDFPQTRPVKNVTLNLGILHNDPEKIFPRYYNSPMTGIGFSYTELGNKSAFGSEISIKPFIMINPAKNLEHPFYFKFGLGMAYYSRIYNQETNPQNKAVGSHFTWDFQAFLYKCWYVNPHLMLNVGAGYLHESNGHIQLPNAGLNKAMISFSATTFFNKVRPEAFRLKEFDRSPMQNFLNIRNGFGLHEFGNTFGPVGGEKKGVYSLAVSGGIIFNRHVKVRGGFTFRFYEHYYDYIEQNNIEQYSENPYLSSSNVLFFLGSEFLVGHFGLDIEGGINLYKPFYRDFFEIFSGNRHLKKHLKNLFTSRLGLNIYLFNTHNNPKNNFFIGGNINANFGQADFSEINVGYTRRLDK